MNEPHVPLWRSWWQRLSPPTPDFYALLNQQCDLVAEGMAELLAYMRTGENSHADRVIELEREGDVLRVENMNLLHQTFITPFDREDIYRSIATIDEIINYARTTVREMRGLNLSPDEHTRAMAELLHEGVLSLQSGYAQLAKKPLLAEADAEAARKMERVAEHTYRMALSELFDAHHYVTTLTPEQRKAADSLEVLMQELTRSEVLAVGSAVGFVIEILKRREVYRHMSNAADRVVLAGEVLHDIIAKIA
ncbi:DUF47 family protein [Crenobacter sp. SG2303]|uniref:DUF47 family protein n=1 Tax=Crenobacter oryzisoli TaxID=3056844 RepID=A0ABT7XSM6_9NEIS|nr:DUF47 family protein [Crenobacter sp. SG2303]MDN0076720.1 DUF47 family protein [Crenobacter sp. SG2303]